MVISNKSGVVTASQSASCAILQPVAKLTAAGRQPNQHRGFAVYLSAVEMPPFEPQ